jgi:hypothetical protein
MKSLYRRVNCEWNPCADYPIFRSLGDMETGMIEPRCLAIPAFLLGFLSGAFWRAAQPRSPFALRRIEMDWPMLTLGFGSAFFLICLNLRDWWNDRQQRR